MLRLGLTRRQESAPALSEVTTLTAAQFRSFSVPLGRWAGDAYSVPVPTASTRFRSAGPKWLCRRPRKTFSARPVPAPGRTPAGWCDAETLLVPR